GDNAVRFFDGFQEPVFLFNGGGDRFFGNDMFVARESFQYQFGTDIGQGADRDGVQGRVRGEILGIPGGGNVRIKGLGFFQALGIQVTGPDDLPAIAFRKGFQKAEAHSAQADDADPVFSRAGRMGRKRGG